MSVDCIEEKYIAIGEVQLENPMFGEARRAEFLAQTIEAANAVFTQEGLDDLLPLSIAPAHFDNDEFYLLHLAGSHPKGEDGAFRYAVERNNYHTPEELAPKIAQAARTYLNAREKFIAQASDARDELDELFDGQAMKLLEVAIEFGRADAETRLAADFTMLEFDLKTAITRRSAEYVSELYVEIEEATELHDWREMELAELQETGCDLFVQHSARILLDRCDLTVEQVLDLLGGNHGLHVHLPNEESSRLLCSFMYLHGVLSAIFGDPRRRWEMREGLFALPVILYLTQSDRIALLGQPLSRVIETGTMLDELPIEGFIDKEDGIGYLDLAARKVPHTLAKGTGKLRAA